MAADHFHLRAIVDMVFAHCEGKSSIATKALSLKCGLHLACKDIFAKLIHPYSTNRARNRSYSFAKFIHTKATKRVTAWRRPSVPIQQASNCKEKKNDQIEHFSYIYGSVFSTEAGLSRPVGQRSQITVQVNITCNKNAASMP